MTSALSRTPRSRSSCSTLKVYSNAAPSHVQVPCPVPMTMVFFSPVLSSSTSRVEDPEVWDACDAVHTDSELPSGPGPGVAAKLSFGPVAFIR